ncbi:SAM-dependent methyltransferase [Streptomyces flavidovirens]|uniref:SAM-dependent methyltransferase n=1 Tax=Streptomyces flavidovirens TaxID=67298 RepID=UPI0036CB9AC0
MTPVAHRLAALLTRCLQGPLPLRLRAWDGSEAGPTDAPVVVPRSRLALICRKPGLADGTRLPDVGCGWGSLSLHAAREYKAGVDQILAVRPTRTGDAGMPGTPHEWYGGAFR